MPAGYISDKLSSGYNLDTEVGILCFINLIKVRLLELGQQDKNILLRKGQKSTEILQNPTCILHRSLQYCLYINYLQYEIGHHKTYKNTCATSEYSDQPAHLYSLIRVLADRMCLLQPPGYPKGDEQETLLYWVDVQADLSLCWSHRSNCRFSRALAQTSTPERDWTYFVASPHI